MSGHSKWSQIKHKKGAADARKGQVFGRLAKEITIAARSESTDPAANSRLRAAVERARSEGVPKENIARAIARASGSAGSETAEIVCEATAPGGIAIIMEASTDSKNRTINEIKHILARHGTRLAEPGSLLWNFEKIGVLEIEEGQNKEITKGEMENKIIESGAADFQETENGWAVETAFEDRDRVRSALEEAKITVAEQGHDWRPRAPIALPPEAREQAERLLDALAKQEDMEEVYTNV